MIDMKNEVANWNNMYVEFIGSGDQNSVEIKCFVQNEFNSKNERRCKMEWLELLNQESMNIQNIKTKGLPQMQTIYNGVYAGFYLKY